MNKAEAWARDTFIKTIAQGSRELGAPVERLCLAVLVRRLAVANIDLDDIIEEVNHHYTHQRNTSLMRAH